ncbi:MAG: Rrf2 family transcriptional regulator [Actinobacteria bacterium]|nr:Rrf2 family transcriptional regulator [Actinomycetota bacterium]MBW3646802.1 Rrf2 family transcriptional regulator [Actinomycetota bacterium]
MHISAKADYAVRAAIHLASVSQGPTKSDAIAAAQEIPAKFLEAIMTSLKAGGIVRSQLGPSGGYWLRRPADAITVADVIRAVDGPLASVRGQRPELVSYTGSAEPLKSVWLAVRSSLREVLEHVTLADLATDQLPAEVVRRAAQPDVWHTAEGPIS